MAVFPLTQFPCATNPLFHHLSFLCKFQQKLTEMEFGKRFLVVMVFLLIATGVSEAQLMPHFYKSTCPNVEGIVLQAVLKKVNKTVVTIPATLRLHFHDCAVEGCDASVMISSPKKDAEKDAPDNMSLAGDGFDTVIKAKEAVEKECPGVVSCADILTMASRDVVYVSGGPHYTVELGRRDGMISKASRVEGNLPGPDDHVDKLNALFRRLNLTQLDMIALSGAHTVGFAHCTRFTDRLYNHSRAAPLDPTLNKEYAKLLMKACPRDVGETIAVNMDPYTQVRFDSMYYKNLIDGIGLFTSDEVLYVDRRTRAEVENFAGNQTSFFRAFSTAMVKLGRYGVKTGKQGEIRRDCTKFNWMIKS